ncbi:hypothetical protein GCM10011504_52170 [Siccirubricoccus deserti]|uniref:Uncharacterized protein n=1 Tax=Siccirubricoccus deserti TaxID=2013562 RepID=A0A9X0R3T7_9PROT|nr:hypothetical protein [Siccirubricoccus deserti]MBC4018690.1 hypothetical protein [Siccirubricoccus deserti]GGC67756.1 hypothetical protein GCM10011504_52170 [Siccirubricoccus deserti]
MLEMPRPHQGNEEVSRHAGGGSNPVRPWYLVSFLGSIAGIFILYYMSLWTLSAVGRLPPPAFTNSICIDEKFAFLRQHPPVSPTLLVIGSSVAWRHFDGVTAERNSPGTVPLNGAFCGQSANQTVYTANWLLDRYPTVREVLFIAAPQDFDDCTTPPTASFNRQDVDGYVFGGTSPWLYYTRYFSLVSLIRNAIEIADKRSGENRIDPLVFDRYGSGPIESDRNRGRLLYGDVERLDPACFEALSHLSVKLQQEGRRLMVASTPLHPQWKLQYDPQGQMRNRFNSGILAALRTGGGQYWDSNLSFHLDETLFFDAIHLLWDGVPKFTEALARAFQFGSVAVVPTTRSVAFLPPGGRSLPPEGQAQDGIGSN